MHVTPKESKYWLSHRSAKNTCQPTRNENKMFVNRWLSAFVDGVRVLLVVLEYYSLTRHLSTRKQAYPSQKLSCVFLRAPTSWIIKTQDWFSLANWYRAIFASWATPLYLASDHQWLFLTSLSVCWGIGGMFVCTFSLHRSCVMCFFSLFRYIDWNRWNSDEKLMEQYWN